MRSQCCHLELRLTIIILATLPTGFVEAITYRTVALSAQPAPGVGTDTSFVSFGDAEISFGNPVINNSGQTAFLGYLQGAAVNGTNNRGVWSEQNGTLALVAQTGSAAPGTSAGVSFRGLGYPVLNDAGQTAFFGWLIGPTVVEPVNDLGIWSQGTGNLGLVARTFSQPPGAPNGAAFESFSTTVYPLFNSAGQTLFSAGIYGPNVQVWSDSGIWSDRSGSLDLVAMEGSAAPGNQTFSNFPGSPVLNDVGQTAFLTLDTVQGTIWSEGGGSMHLVTRSGFPATGAGAGITFRSFGYPLLNNAGRTVFIANMQGSGLDFKNDGGLWEEDGTTLDLVVREGDMAPGTDGSTVFMDILSPVINREGEIAFSAGLRKVSQNFTSSRGIFSNAGGTLHLVAKNGSPAPGTSAGVLFSGIGDPSLNAAGQIAFSAILTGDGVDASNDFGIWAQGPYGLQLIAREGELFAVAPGDLRTIAGGGFLMKAAL